MTQIHVVTRDGEEKQIETTPGEPLMWALRDQNVDVEAVCGGAVSCATCHVYVDQEWVESLESPDDFEAALLEDLVHADKRSRLSCQLIMTDALKGLRCTIAPSED